MPGLLAKNGVRAAATFCICLVSKALAVPEADPVDNRLLENLGSPLFEEREAAQKALIERGPAAEASVEALRTSSDLEVRMRAEVILGRVWHNLTPSARAKRLMQEEAFAPIRKAWPAMIGALVRGEPIPSEVERQWPDSQDDPPVKEEGETLTRSRLLEILRWTISQRVKGLAYRHGCRTARSESCLLGLRTDLRWGDLLAEARDKGELTGQRFEDLYLFLMGDGWRHITPFPEWVFGDGEGIRTVFQTLANMTERRPSETEPAKDWEEAVRRLSSREFLRSLKRHIGSANPPNGLHAIKSEDLMESLKAAGNRKPPRPAALEMALYPSLIELHVALMLSDPEGPVKEIDWSRLLAKKISPVDGAATPSTRGMLIDRAQSAVRKLSLDAQKRALWFLLSMREGGSKGTFYLDSYRSKPSDHDDWLAEANRLAKTEKSRDDLTLELFLALVK